MDNINFDVIDKFKIIIMMIYIYHSVVSWLIAGD